MKTSYNYTSFNKCILSCILIFFIACKKDKDNVFDEKLLAKIANEQTELPSAYSSIPFFGRCSGKQIAVVYVQDLRVIHFAKYKDLDYKDFLEKSLNQQISIEYKDKIECFDLEKGIVAKYDNGNFEDFLNLYTERTASGKLILKSSVTESQINTILYYLFLNNYLSSFDDNVGKYFINTTDAFIE